MPDPWGVTLRPSSKDMPATPPLRSLPAGESKHIHERGKELKEQNKQDFNKSDAVRNRTTFQINRIPAAQPINLNFEKDRTEHKMAIP